MGCISTANMNSHAGAMGTRVKSLKYRNTGCYSDFPRYDGLRRNAYLKHANDSTEVQVEKGVREKGVR